ncbi:non-homologous end joining protein Ku [Streptacidiphilus anmyonensis]|uniref:non-homologous end joining protein Ku n=1 Tax=Streptacidiphilus anmyonensis TaxID=405782 RepID=UPI0005A64ED6|nr:Ku protein [Streptacidiphilus anmyonensis]
MSSTSAEAPLGRPVWTGSITFGLVAVPVRLFTATEGHSGPVTHQHHADDLGRIRYRKFCEAEDRELRPDEIARGWEVPDGAMVVLTDDDIERLPLPTKHVIDVHAFLPEAQIDPLSWDTPYYVGLGEKAPAKPYVLLARALRESGQVAVTKIALRDRESLAVLRERDGLLILQTVKWPDEIRTPAGIRVPTADEPIHRNEIQMALQLAASMSRDYDLDAERDQYVRALDELLAAKTGGGEVERGAEPAAAAAPAVDLMAALQASIAESQAKRGEKPGSKKAAAGKSTAKKTTAKKTASKRAS